MSLGKNQIDKKAKGNKSKWKKQQVKSILKNLTKKIDELP